MSKNLVNNNKKVLKGAYLVQIIGVIALITLSIIGVWSDFVGFRDGYYFDREFLQDSDFDSMSIDDINAFCDEFDLRFTNDPDKAVIDQSFNFIDFNKSVDVIKDNCRDNSRYTTPSAVLIESFKQEAENLQGYEFSFYRYVFATTRPTNTPYLLLLIISIGLGLYGMVIDKQFRKFIGTLNINEENAKIYFADRLKELKHKNVQGLMMITIVFSLFTIWITEGRMLLFPGFIFLILYLIVGIGVSLYFKSLVKIDKDTFIADSIATTTKTEDGLYNVLSLQNKYLGILQTNKTLHMTWRRVAILALLLVPMGMIAIEMLVTIFLGR